MSSVSHRNQINSDTNQKTWWEVVEIVAEEGKRYRVRWAGKDPKTGKPWPLAWVPSSSCTPDLVKEWEEKKAKESGSSASAPIAMLPQVPVARERPSERRNSTSEPLIHSTLKRKRSSSPSNTDQSSVPSKLKRFATPVDSRTGGDSKGDEGTAAHSETSRNKMDTPGTEESPLHPPLEEIEMWVPTPHAKFGPPKRNRAAGERRDFGGQRAYINVSAIPSAQPLASLPSLQRPVTLSESQVIALREEEEESQSQPLDLPPTPDLSDNPIQYAVPPDPLPSILQPSSEGVGKVISVESAERPTVHPTLDTQLTNGSANTGHVSKPDREASYSQLDATNTSSPGRGVTEGPKNTVPPPAPAHPSPTSPQAAALSQETPLGVEPAMSVPQPITKSHPSSSEQRSHSRMMSCGSGTLAERRAFEARVRLDELRRAAARFPSNVTTGQNSAWKPFRVAEQLSPHVMLQQAMNGLESPSQSQIAAAGNPETEISASASISEDRGTQEDSIPPSKTGQTDDSGRPLRQDGIVMANVSVVHDNKRSSQEEVPPTASGSTQSQSHTTSSQASLGGQLAVALNLLHKRSEEISELQAQVRMLHRQTTDGRAKLGHEPTVTGALYPKERTEYLAAAVQTDQDETLALWAEEKTALQGVVETLRADKARALADVEFFRAQYSRASDFASSARSENEELLARATLAESQTTNGVAMVRATFETRVSKLEAEVQKYKALSEMLTERARRTDDDVRYRAAMAPELERQYQQLHRQFRETEAELEETKDDLRAERKGNRSLRKLVMRLEAKEQANVGKSPDQEPLPWSDGKDDPDYVPGTTPPSCPSEDSHRSSLQYQRSRDEEDVVMLVRSKVEQRTPVEPGAEPGERAQTNNYDVVYLCRWRPGEPERDCDAVVASKQELHEHVLSHHLSCH